MREGKKKRKYIYFSSVPTRCVSSTIYCISAVNTQHIQEPDVLVELDYIWRHVSAVKRPSSAQQLIVLLKYILSVPVI
jgi:hypothetical protein